MTRITLLFALTLGACALDPYVPPADEPSPGDTDEAPDIGGPDDPADAPSSDAPQDDDLEDEDPQAGDASEETGDDDPSTGEDLLPDTEPRAVFTFLPDSSAGPDAGYALFVGDAVQRVHDDEDLLELEASFGDSGAASLQLEIMLVCEGNAVFDLVDEISGELLAQAPCAPFRPTRVALEDGGLYLGIVSAGDDAAIDYDLYLTVSTVF